MFGISLHPSKKEEMLSPNLLLMKQLEHTDTHADRQQQKLSPSAPLRMRGGRRDLPTKFVAAAADCGEKFMRSRLNA